MRTDLALWLLHLLDREMSIGLAKRAFDVAKGRSEELRDSIRLLLRFREFLFFPPFVSFIDLPFAKS